MSAAFAPCLQQIFAERVPTIVAPFARRTARLQALQQQLGLVLGGVLGAISRMRPPSVLAWSCRGRLGPSKDTLTG